MFSQLLLVMGTNELFEDSVNEGKEVLHNVVLCDTYWHALLCPAPTINAINGALCSITVNRNVILPGDSYSWWYNGLIVLWQNVQVVGELDVACVIVIYSDNYRLDI